MKIVDIKVSEFEVKSNTQHFRLRKTGRLWEKYDFESPVGRIHILHVVTEEGLEGISTVGDARYTTMSEEALSYLKYLVIGEDPTNRDYLFDMLSTATRMIFMPPGWFGAFDNCLWDIEGKIQSKSVSSLISHPDKPVKAYYNYRGPDLDSLIEDAKTGIGKGFKVLKDHFAWTAEENIIAFESVRAAVGDEIVLLHDAAGCSYSLDEAIEVADQLYQQGFEWFEEPLNDRKLGLLKKLCSVSEIPILGLETLMNDFVIMREWVREGAVNIVRGNARHGTTGILRIAKELEKVGINIELNGPGGLFGHVHAQLVAGISNTSYYEYFPDGSRDAIGKEIGLLNPPIPLNGEVNLAENPGWGYEFDWKYFKDQRVRVF